MAKFSNQQDVQSTIEAGQNNGGSDNIKLEEGNNYIIILSDDYEQGYQHWIKTSAKTFKRTCLADIEDKGWDPDGCPGCGLTLDMYNMKKQFMAEGDTKTAKDYNERGNKLRAGYSSIMKAVKGKAVIERKLNKKTGKKVKKWVPDFEEMEIGTLRLTHAQVSKLFALVEDDNYPQIESAEDLVGRVINFFKEKVDDKDLYARVTKVIPSKRVYDVESLEIDEDDVPEIEEEFALDDDFEEVVELYRQELEEDEEEEYEKEDMKKTSKKKNKKATSKKATSKKSAAKKKKRKPVEEEEEEEEEEEIEEEEELEEEEIEEEEEEETEDDEDDDWEF